MTSSKDNQAEKSGRAAAAAAIAGAAIGSAALAAALLYAGRRKTRTEHTPKHPEDAPETD